MVFGLLNPDGTQVNDPYAGVSSDEKDGLRTVREASNRHNPYLYALRASAYTQILYVHGLQHFAYSLAHGRMIDLREENDDRANVIFNVILPTVESQVSLFLSRAPEREVVSVTRDETDIEAARYASDMLRWQDEFVDIHSVREEAAAWLTHTGNVCIFTGWDPTGGRFFTDEQGQMVFEGDPILRADSMFAWTFHPQAKTVKESVYAHHTGLVSPDFLSEHFPDKYKKIPEAQAYTTEEGRLFENALLNLSPSHGGLLTTGNAVEIPDKEGYHELQTVYFRSSPRHPQGRMIMALARAGEPYMLLHDGPNPYIDWSTGQRTLPVVLIKNIPLPGRFWGESFVLHMMPQQRSINKHRSQIHDNAEYNANLRMYYFTDGVAPETITNDPGDLIPVSPGSTPPGYIPAPELPSYLIQAEQAALQFLEILTRPLGPLREQEANVTSGIHQMIVEESKKQQVAPMMHRWERGWDRVTKLQVDNWRSFASIPRKMEVPGDVDSWRQTYFSGELAKKNFIVRVVEGSAIPTSRVATFAEWVELIKSGAAPIQIRDDLASQFWKDIGKPQLARTYRDINAQIDKARNNIKKARMGQITLADPRLDDPKDHLPIYRNWMLTTEYEREVAENPQLDFFMTTLVDSFIQLQKLQELQIQLQMAAMAQMGKPPSSGEADRATKVQGSAQARKPGETGGDAGSPRATQGFGDATPNGFAKGIV